METIGINTMASKSERATRIFILPKVWLLSCDSTDLVKRPSTRARSQGPLVMSSLRPASVAGGGEQFRRAVRQNRGGVATRFEIAQNRAGIGKGVERQICAEQLWLERLVDGRKAREGQIERAFRQRPEIEIAAGESQRPAIFELLGTPELGETIGIGPGGRPIPADGGMHVEKRAIGIEDESAWHGQASEWDRQ